ncbi:MAG: MFS transporter [Pseudomonadota bacterium]
MLVKPEEQRATIAAFATVFLLMGAYFVLRPVRDAIASDWSDSEVSLLWNLQFFLSMGLVALYGLAVSKLHFRHVAPAVYGLFALSFLGFHLLAPRMADPTLVEKAFYLWVTAFSLLNLSVFWSYMAQVFRRDQGERLFAIISAGASAGAILGPGIPTLFAESLGLDGLMLLAAVGLLAVIPLVLYIDRLRPGGAVPSTAAAGAGATPVGGRWWAGFRDVARNPTLRWIGLFLLLYVFIGSFVYFEQKNLLAAYARPERTAILGGIDWIVNTLTFVFAFFLTGRIMRRWGMATTLALVPVAVAVSLLALAAAPTVLVLLGLQVVRRVGNYSITRPAREVLFTQVSTEERFKAKSVIDVVVYRGGDAVSGSLFALLTDGLGIALAAVSLVGASLAACWAAVGVRIGRRFDAGGHHRAGGRDAAATRSSTTLTIQENTSS